VDSEVVDQGTHDSTDKRCDYRYPEVIARARDSHRPPTGEEGEQTRTKVTGRVDGISRVESTGTPLLSSKGRRLESALAGRRV